MDGRYFDVKPNDPGVAVLLTDDKQRPAVIAGGYGFGRVTMIGLDLTDPRITKANPPLPSGERLWNAVFGWNAKIFPDEVLDTKKKEREIWEPSSRTHHFLDAFIPRKLAMRETAASALLLAILLYGAYWRLAGPIGFAVP